MHQASSLATYEGWITDGPARTSESATDCDFTIIMYTSPFRFCGTTQLPSVMGENWLPPLYFQSQQTIHKYLLERESNLRSNERTKLRSRGIPRIRKLQVRPHSRLLRILQRDRGESLDVQVRPLRTAVDELGREREHGPRSQRGIERRGHRLGARRHADERLVSCLDSDDRRRSGKHIGGVNKGRGTEVGGYTDGFEDAGGGYHGLCVLERGVEVVVAGFDGFGSGAGDGGLEGGYVGGFCLADGHEGFDLGVCEAEGGEVGHGEFGEALGVEG